ncbi:Flp pilus assembly protein CpaB [Nocardioides cynanchi]|uniref:Flp pilus assembly protein CpaB n=1 Tax=Nocardioides cynanchi TaxID=2558918 RepID=UPI001247D143|nr:Flp pilus assembly protein CpaB [Nocardioides cynanchi]
MDRRRLLLILAVFVAVIGTALVFLYVRGADSRAKSSVSNIQVLEATSNVAAGEKYDDALAAGKISLQPVPKDFAVANTGYQTSVDTLKGKIASVPIFAGQVIVASQFGDTVVATSSSLAIPPGMIAISVNLTDPDRVAGNIQNGQNVAIFVTGQLLAKANSGTSSSTTSTDIQATRLLLPKVTVLNVGSPQPPTTTTSTDSNGTQTTEQLPRTLLTIAVTQKDAQKVIVASKALDLTFGLLTPQSNVKPGPGTSTLISSLFK